MDPNSYPAHLIKLFMADLFMWLKPSCIYFFISLLKQTAMD